MPKTILKLIYIRYFVLILGLSTATLNVSAAPKKIKFDFVDQINLVHRNGSDKGHIIKSPKRSNIGTKFIQALNDTIIGGKRIVRSDTRVWKKIVSKLDTEQKKAIAGEILAKLYFEFMGYTALETTGAKIVQLTKMPDAGRPDMYETSSCTSKKGPDNGIDGVFIKDETVAINEAKYRAREDLRSDDFGFVVGHIQQSHSDWNRDHFNGIDCDQVLPKYDDIKDLKRYATLLTASGYFKIYKVTDAQMRND